MSVQNLASGKVILMSVQNIQSVANSMQTAFPSADCQELAQANGVNYQCLVSDLDAYFYDVWSPANGVKKLSQKPMAWLCDLQADLKQSFFVRYPQYAALQAAINSKDAPNLSRRLAAADALRQNLLAYLAELL